MSDRPSDDRDLRDRFAALRESDAAAAPPFEELWRRARREAASSSRDTAGRARSWAGLAAGVAALAVTAGVLVARREAATSLDATIAQAKELSSWSAPTDTLLDLVSLDSRPASDASRP